MAKCFQYIIQCITYNSLHTRMAHLIQTFDDAMGNIVGKIQNTVEEYSVILNWFDMPQFNIGTICMFIF